VLSSAACSATAVAKSRNDDDCDERWRWCSRTMCARLSLRHCGVEEIEAALNSDDDDDDDDEEEAVDRC
jgi:hypothetical protein